MKPVAMTPDAEAALARAGFSRRAFLKSSGALIVGFSVAGSASRLGLAPVEAFAQAAADRRAQLDSWIAIAADGNITAYTGKCELGKACSPLKRSSWPRNWACRSTACGWFNVTPARRPTRAPRREPDLIPPTSIARVLRSRRQPPATR